MTVACLNPCCSRQWYRTSLLRFHSLRQFCLNPCCSGQWSRTLLRSVELLGMLLVLILVVVDNGLVQIISGAQRNDLLVLILVVMDNGIVLC